jgi:hypothetical protein
MEQPTKQGISYYAKAVVGSTVSGLAVLELALEDNFVTGVEWVRVATAFLVALALVWGVQNQPRIPEHF